ncbi:cryptochrome/photolyase family protein [bacterium]|nr:cryptochrome/photolyase family protein [bacterium]
MMMPAEPYMQRKFLAIQKKLKEQDITLSFLKNTQFLLEHDEFLSMYKKPPVMETFYRTMRKKLNILMQ